MLKTSFGNKQAARTTVVWCDSPWQSTVMPVVIGALLHNRITVRDFHQIEQTLRRIFLSSPKFHLWLNLLNKLCDCYPEISKQKSLGSRIPWTMPDADTKAEQEYTISLNAVKQIYYHLFDLLQGPYGWVGDVPHHIRADRVIWKESLDLQVRLVLEAVQIDLDHYLSKLIDQPRISPQALREKLNSELAANATELSWDRIQNDSCVLPVYTLHFEHVLFAGSPPLELHMDDMRRLHCTEGPAIKFADGYQIYCVDDRLLGRDYFDEFGFVNAATIQSESNLELRRVLINLYGIDRFLTELGARERQSDEFGTLIDSGEYTYVRVVNSTAEPDGHYKEYYLRVPPWMKTAHEAVAWTFDMTEVEYAPSIQT